MARRPSQETLLREELGLKDRPTLAQISSLPQGFPLGLQAQRPPAARVLVSTVIFYALQLARESLNLLVPRVNLRFLRNHSVFGFFLVSTCMGQRRRKGKQLSFQLFLVSAVFFLIVNPWFQEFESIDHQMLSFSTVKFLFVSEI